MIELAQGNSLEAEVEALINTVNSMGYMGEGTALQFKPAWPECFHGLNDRMRAMFNPDHIRIAWQRLLEQGRLC